MTLMWKSNRYFLGLLFTVALTVRLIFFMCHTVHQDHAYLGFDSAQYAKVAHNIAAGNGIAQEPGVPNFYRLPGYPLFLATCYRIFGGNDYIPLFLQLILASFIPVLVFLLSLVLFPGNGRTARYAGIIAAVHFGLIHYAGIMATESLFIVFLLLFFIFFFPFIIPGSEYLDVSQRKILLIAGAMLGCASLFRAVGHYLIVVSIVLLTLSVAPIKTKLWRSFALLVGWLSVVGWWLARNYLLTGFLFFHTLPGLHFLQYAAVNADMGYVNFGDDAYFATKKKLLKEWESLVKAQEKTEKKTLNEYERYDLAQGLAVQYLAKNPFLTVKNAIVNVVRTVGTLYSSLLLYVAPGTVYQRGTSLWFKVKLYLQPCVQQPWLRYVIYWDLLLYFFLLAGTLLFFWVARRNKGLWKVAKVIFPFILLFLAITLAYGCARLRLPIEPFFIIVSAWFFDGLGHHRLWRMRGFGTK